MNNSELIIIVVEGLVSFIIGGAVVWAFTKNANKGKEKIAEEKAQSILKEAESKAEIMKKDRMMEAKEKFYQLKTEHEKSIAEKDKNMAIAENKLKQKEVAMSQKMEQSQRKQTEVEAIQQNLKNQLEVIKIKLFIN